MLLQQAKFISSNLYGRVFHGLENGGIQFSLELLLGGVHLLVINSEFLLVVVAVVAWPSCLRPTIMFLRFIGSHLLLLFIIHYVLAFFIFCDLFFVVLDNYVTVIRQKF